MQIIMEEILCRSWWQIYFEDDLDHTYQHQASKCETFQHNPIERPAVGRLERAGGEQDLLMIIFKMLLIIFKMLVVALIPEEVDGDDELD